MGRSRKPDERCGRHPRHQQPPGVCSLCLSEKLTQLSSGAGGGSSSSRSTAASFNGAEDSSYSSSSSLSPYESTSSASSQLSPLRRYRSVKGSGLFGARSIALITRRRVKEEGGSKRKGGFWSRLIPGLGRKTGSGEG